MQKLSQTVTAILLSIIIMPACKKELSYYSGRVEASQQLTATKINYTVTKAGKSYWANPVTNLYDGKLTTWYSTEDTNSFTLTLDTLCSVDSLALSAYAGTGIKYYFKVYGSIDGITYQLLLNDSTNTANGTRMQGYRTNSMLARYIKFVGLGNNNGIAAYRKANSYDEIAFYTTGIAVLPPVIEESFFSPTDSRIHIVSLTNGNDTLPRFYLAGSYVQFGIIGSKATVYLNDEQQWRNEATRASIQVIVDGNVWGRVHLDLKAANVPNDPTSTDPRKANQPAQDSIVIAGLSDGAHNIQLIKDKEAIMGYLEFKGVRAQNLVDYPLPNKRLCFIGDSQTNGWGADTAQGPTNHWSSYEVAYDAFTVQTAKMLNTQWLLCAQGGIGLLTANDRGFTIDQIYNKVKPYDNTIEENYGQYVPDAFIITIGQNDDPTSNVPGYINKYINWVNEIHGHYPDAKFFLLNGPMAYSPIKQSRAIILKAIVDSLNSQNIHSNYFEFANSYNAGMLQHPNAAQGVQAAKELSSYLATKL